MFVTGMGADDSMEMITTRTSGRDGGHSRAKCNRTRKLCSSKIVTGNMLPVSQDRRREETMSKREGGGEEAIIHSRKLKQRRVRFLLGLMDSRGTVMLAREISS